MRFLILFAAVCAILTNAASDDLKIVCYYSSWASYRSTGGTYEIENIDPNLCTHLIYAFVGLEDNDIKVLDPKQDLPDNSGKNGFGRFGDLRKQNPKLKTMVAIGGWNAGSSKFSLMASFPSFRDKFVKNVVAFLKKYEFDGLDIDWEYPAQRGGAPSDPENFVSLLKELSQAFEKDKLILSAAVRAIEYSAAQSYNIAGISKYVDFINLMTYDLNTAGDVRTGIQTALYATLFEYGLDRQFNVDNAVLDWLSQGADNEKLVVGIATYGRTFTLADPKAARVEDPVRGPGKAGPYTGEPGMLGYNEICELQQKNNWTVKYDDERRAPYAYSGDQWVSYDNVESVKEKAAYIERMSLAGAMIWAMDTDDFNGNCGDKYPLINAVNGILRKTKAVTTTPPPATELTSTKPNSTDSSTAQPTQEPTTQSSTTLKPTEGPTTAPTSPTPTDQSTTPPTPEPTTQSSTTKMPTEVSTTAPTTLPTTTGQSTTQPTPDTTQPSNTFKPTEEATIKPIEQSTNPRSLGEKRIRKPNETRQSVKKGRGDSLCTQSGFIADPTTCKKFIRCIDLGNGAFSPIYFDCAPGLCYKKEIGVCDWPAISHHG